MRSAVYAVLLGLSTVTVAFAQPQRLGNTPADLVVSRAADGCKLIVPMTPRGGALASWEVPQLRNSKFAPIDCRNGLATLKLPSGVTTRVQFMDQSGRSGGMYHVNLIVDGYALTRDVGFPPSHRLDAGNRQHLLFRIGGDPKIDSEVYLIATSSFPVWTVCDREASVFVKTKNESPFAAGTTAPFINNALETTGFVCPDMRRLSVQIGPDMADINNSQNLYFAGSYIQSTGGWSAEGGYGTPRNFVALRLAARQAQQEKEQIAKIEKAKTIYRIASAQPTKRGQTDAVITPLMGPMTDPIVARSLSLRKNAPVPVIWPVEIKNIDSGVGVLAWPYAIQAIIAGPAASTAPAPGWYFIKGEYRADEGLDSGQLTINNMLRCKQSRCQDDIADLLAEASGIPDLRQHIGQ